jgi:hypothetical protein
VLLAWAVFAVFSQAIRCEFVHVDDDVYVYENPAVVKGLTFPGVSQVFAHRMYDFHVPLTMVSLMLDNQVYGLNPGGENLIVLHTLAAAYAGAGRFNESQRSAQEAMALARAAGQSYLVEQLNSELKLYAAGFPLHQESK